MNDTVSEDRLREIISSKETQVEHRGFPTKVEQEVLSALRELLEVRAYLAATKPPLADEWVKALEWGGRRTTSEGNWAFDAKTSIGWYIAASSSGEGCKGTWHWFIVGGTISGWANSEAEAKAAAQADYEQRILSTLASPPMPGRGEGFVLVPEWPSEAMIEAGLESLRESTGEQLLFINRDPHLAYRAMLAASRPKEEKANG